MSSVRSKVKFFIKGKRQKTDRRMVERELNVKLLPVLVGLFGILYLLTGFRGWLVFFIGTFALWLLSFLWVKALEHSLSIERRLQLAWATVGESVHEEFNVINRSRLPALWVEIVDETETPDSPLRLVSDVDANAQRRRHSVHLFKRRGFYTLGPTRLRTSDPFGIYTLTLHDQHSSSILVMPPQLPLTQLKLAMGGWAGDKQRQRGVLEREISEAGVRNYLPGDSLRRIHWRASAHSNSLMVRRLDAAASDDWRIFVDLEAAAQAGTEQDSTLELAVVLAASLILRGWREHRRVGLALAGPKLVWMEPRSDPAHHWRMMQALAMAKAGGHSLADVMSLAGPTRTATSIVITPSTDTSWVAASRPSHGDNSIITLLIDPVEFGRAADQGKLLGVLRRNGIPSARMPRSLLEQAYPFLAGNARKPFSNAETKRYMRHEREPWQSIR